MYLKTELYELIRTDERIFDFIQESALDGLWYWDLENPENEWMSAKFWTVLGYSPDEMPHKSSSWQGIINQDDLKLATENFARHCENPDHPYDQVVRYTHKDGSTVWIHCRGIAIRDNTGKPIRMLGAHQDISDIKNRELELIKAKEKSEESEQNLSITLHSIGDGVITTDNFGMIDRMNPVALKLCGWHEDEIKGKPLTEVFNIIDAYTRGPVPNPVEKVMENGGIVGLANHTVLVARDGSEYQIADSAAPIKNQNGEISGVVLVFSDVTEKYKTEEKLRESEERLNMAMMVKNDGMWDWDLVTNSTFFDDRYYTMAGYAPGNFPKTLAGWARKVHPEDLQASKDAIKAYMRGASDDFNIEFRFRRKDGSWMWIEGKGKIIDRDKRGKPLRMIGTHTDITHRKQVEEALRKSEATIRNKLNAILEPEGDIETLNLADIINADELQAMMEDFYNTSQIGGAILDVYGKVLVGVAWSDICTKFHRVHPNSAKNCKESDLVLASGVPVGTFKAYRCKNNMWDMVSPIEIGGKHLGNIYIGQFFYEDEHVDYELFKNQARQHGFDEMEYIAALDRVPRLKRETVNSAMAFYTKLAEMISSLSYSKIKLSRDIAQRKRVEMRLKDSEKKHRLLFETANDAILIIENDVFIDCNSKAEEVFGCKKEQIIGKTLFDFSTEFQPDGSASAALAKERTKATVAGENQFFEWHHKRFDGSLLDVEISLSAFTINNKTLIQSIVRDLTERKETDKTKQVLFQIANEVLHRFKLDDFIKAVEKQLSQLVDTTNFYIALYDSETGMLSAPFEKDEKDSVDTWPSKGSATGLVIEKKQSVLLQKHDVLYLIETGEIKQTGSICEAWLGVPLFNGTDVSGVIVVQSYDNPEAFDSNTMELFEYVSNQISMALERTRFFEDLMHAKNKAEESDRLKSAFLANMSHEIRTPMNGIMGFAELLKDPLLSDEKQQQYIEIIEKSGVRMLNIINDIVDVSRIEAGVMEVYLAESDINEQLDYIYTFFRTQVEAKGMQLIMPKALPSGQEKTITDREKLFAILTNLVKNAIKYSKKGTIEYGCNKKGSFLEFFVRDTGIGIPKDRQHAIFERFVQADIEDIEARQGAGLGLAISRAYVEMLGGEIWVESEEGRGATFYFTIPYKTDHQETDAQTVDESAVEKEDQAKRLKVLIVEDDESSALLMSKYVQPLSKIILQADSGTVAVEICKNHPDIDLILMDMKMPGMDGEKATRQIRKFNKDVVIIAQTAKALRGDRQSMLDGGCNDYISKPINKNEIQELVQRYFGE